LWHGYIIHFPKIHRYSLGIKIDSLLVEIIADIAYASFTSPAQKLPFIQRSIRNTDTVKILLTVANKVEALDDKKYFAITEPLIEIGRILGGWSGQIIKNTKENPLK
jgi:hypothetical protein